MIKLGIIGCGEHSESGHAIPLARFQRSHPNEIELSAVCDVKRERAELFCHQYGFLRSYVDADEMLAGEKLDGCVAVVPVEKIPFVSAKLLKLRLPCVIEKPLGASVEDIRTLLEEARRSNTPNMVSVNRRFMPFLNHAMDWTKTIGSLRYVRCTFTRHQRNEPEFLWGTAVHAVDALRYIAGDVAEANVRTLLPVGGAANWYTIDLQFKSGVIGRIDVLPTAGVLDETYELIGEGFRAVVTCPFGQKRGIQCFRENQLVKEESSDGMPEDVVNGCYDEAAAFVNALARKERPRPSIEEVFPSVKLCLELAMAASAAKENVVSAKS